MAKKLYKISDTRRRQLYRAEETNLEVAPKIKELKKKIDEVDSHFRHMKGRIKKQND